MFFRIYIALIFCLLPELLAAQNALAGSGNCFDFDGTDDFVDLNPGSSNSYNLPITVTAWINMNPNGSGEYPIFSSNDQNSTNSGLYFWLTDTTINAGYGNGQTGNFLQNIRRRQFVSDSIKGQWMHVAAVFKTTGIDLYLNGVQTGGQNYNSGISYLPSFSGSTVIGRKTDGNNTSYYNGKMDEFVIWEKALNTVEVRQNMCKKMLLTPIDINRYFRFDELNGGVVLDRSQNASNAQAQNGLSIIRSAAPLGEATTYIYQTGSWNGYTHNFGSSNGNNFKVSNVQGDPDGLQMYWVEQAPNTFDTLDWICAEGGYLGVFICRQSTQQHNYNLEFNYNNNNDVLNFIQNTSTISLKSRYSNEEFWSTRLMSATNNKFTATNENTRSEYALSGLHVAPVVDIPDTVSCADSIVLSVPQNIVYSYLWSNGGTQSTNVFRQPGQHWVIYGDSCGNSTVIDSFQVTIGFSNLNIGNDTVLCAGETLVLDTKLAFASHTWQDGSTGSTFTVTQPGVYWVTASFAQCSGSDTIVVDYENVVPFTLGNDTSFCFGDSIYLDATSSGATTYLWNTGETTSGIWASSSGVYNVIAGQGRCIESSSIFLDVSLDDVNFSPDTLICSGQQAIFWVSGAQNYNWSTGYRGDTLRVFPTQTTQYTVTIEENGCTETLSFIATVTDKISTAEFEYEVNACLGEVTFTNLSQNADTYLWDFGDGKTSTDVNPIHIYENGGRYLVKLVASKNSCPDTAVSNIQLIQLENIIYFADAFTPNDDGLNDYYEVKGSGECFIEPVFIIQNRWGAEVFRTNSPFEEFWDGNLNSKTAPQGVYFYSFYSHTFHKQGQFTLVR
jgi:gliding motility-associated-like protein